MLAPALEMRLITVILVLIKRLLEREQAIMGKLLLELVLVHMGKPRALTHMVKLLALVREQVRALAVILKLPILRPLARKHLAITVPITMPPRLLELTPTTKTVLVTQSMANTATKMPTLHPALWQPKVSSSRHTTLPKTEVLLGRESFVLPSVAVFAWV
jgi:hypothetical protein